MADEYAFFAHTVTDGARRLRIRHALAELRREKTMRGLRYPAYVAWGQMKAEEAETRNISLDDAIDILDALTRHDIVLCTTAAQVRALRGRS